MKNRIWPSKILKTVITELTTPWQKKILGKVADSPTAPPEDISITTLFVGNVDQRISEKDLRDHFYYFGEIASLNVVHNQHCAFIEFTTREASEAAITKLYNNLIVNGVFLRLAWAKPHQLGLTTQALALPAGGNSGTPYYPSMDPERLGAKPEGGFTGIPTTTTQRSAPPKPNWDEHPRPADDVQESAAKKN